jgi:hypothetical protein
MKMAASVTSFVLSDAPLRDFEALALSQVPAKDIRGILCASTD